jgi:hypothetical protein
MELMSGDILGLDTAVVDCADETATRVDEPVRAAGQEPD